MYECLCVYVMSFHDCNPSLLPRLSKTYHIMLSGRTQHSRVILFLFVQSNYMVVIGVCSYHLPSEITLSEAVRLFVPSGIIFLLIKKKKSLGVVLEVTTQECSKRPHLIRVKGKSNMG